MAVTAQSWYQLGVMALRTGKLVEAEAAFAAVVLLDTKHANAYYYLGDVAQQQGRVEDARQFYRKVLSLHPGHVSAERRLASLQNSPSSRVTATSGSPRADSGRPYQGQPEANRRTNMPDESRRRPINELDMPRPGEEDEFQAGLTAKKKLQLKATIDATPMPVLVLFTIMAIFVVIFLIYTFVQVLR